MGVLWEIEGEYEWFRTGVLDFHTTAIQCRLCDEADLGIKLTEFHVLMIIYFKLTNPSTSSIGVKESRTVRAELGLAAWRYRETED